MVIKNEELLQKEAQESRKSLKTWLDRQRRGAIQLPEEPQISDEAAERIHSQLQILKTKIR